MDCHIKTKYFHEKNCKKKKFFNAFIDILKLSIKKLGELQKNPTPPQLVGDLMRYLLVQGLRPGVGKICSEVYFNTAKKKYI